MKSLLHKNMSQFVACIIIVLLLATPLFYLLTRYYYSEDLLDVIESVKRGGPIPQLDLERDIFEGIVIQFVLIFVVLSISLLVMMRFATKHLWHPFDDTLKKMERFNIEQNKVPELEPTNIKEFDRLNSAILQLVNRDMKTYNSQKEFTENASHELQTPIAIFQSKLDLLLQEPLSESQARIVEELYSVSKRMSRLNRNMLLLAKIENRQYDQMGSIDAASRLKNGIQQYEALRSGSRIHLVDDSCGRLVINANVSLFDSLVQNLIMNAIRHSSSGTVEIHISDDAITVSNPSTDGRLDENALFRRFSNMGCKTCGNGLGLAIAKAICDYHKWGIRYYYDGNGHHFCVKFGRS